MPVEPMLLPVRSPLQHLRQLLAESSDPLSELGSVAEPRQLAVLLRAELAAAVRRGPAGEGPSPAELVAVAERAAQVGLLPWQGTVAMRRTLDDLERELKRCGAWAESSALWWQPLPKPVSAVNDWQDGSAQVRLPAFEDLQQKLQAGARRWHLQTACISAATRQRVMDELIAADSEMRLEASGVGATNRASKLRSDEVRYLTGLEPDLLATTPQLALLIQRCFATLESWLDGVEGDGEAGPWFLPQSAMLARYDGPSRGFDPHLDNPGGEADNGRAVAIVFYLNAPGEDCQGGELALWRAGRSTSDAPDEVIPVVGGSAAFFTARNIAHQVRPLQPGPARWTLVFWLGDRSRQAALPEVPVPNTTDALFHVANPLLAKDRLLCHELDAEHHGGQLLVYSRGPRVHGSTVRCGIVATVYGAGDWLENWCRHHLATGADHLVLVFDHPDEPAESATLERLASQFSDQELTLWRRPQLAAERWQQLPAVALADDLLAIAESGSSSHGHAARQALNASVALAAARTDELGGRPLDWLAHLDADELLQPLGAARGGTDLQQHFAAMSAAGLDLIHYLNDELLPSEASQAATFKINPRLAMARLGSVGWQAMTEALDMSQQAVRPYFTGYQNGKAAVRVAAASAAAGVHSWSLRTSGRQSTRFLAGPTVLHFRFSSAQPFIKKYLDIANQPHAEGLFELAAIEQAAVRVIRECRSAGTSEEELEARLCHLHSQTTRFSTEEADLLNEAGLLHRPMLKYPLK